MRNVLLSKVLVPTLKLTLGLTIIAYLLYQAQRDQKFDELVHQPKDWSLLALAIGCIGAAVLLGFVRWYLLVRAIGLPFSLADAIRLGSLGFALNFVGPGGVGGDVFKAVALAREHHTRRSEAVATVIADRVIGLLSLLAIASIATLVSGTLWDNSSSTMVRALGGVTVVSLLAGVVLGLLLMAPGKVSRATANLLARLPWGGKVAQAMFDACQAMSRRPERLIPAVALGLVVHVLLVLSFDAVSRGLPLSPPSLIDHLRIVPLAETVGVLPITPGGLGTTEAALGRLYETCNASKDDGLIVALGQRVGMLSVGIVAIAFYFAQRRAVQRSLYAEELAASRV